MKSCFIFAGGDGFFAPPAEAAPGLVIAADRGLELCRSSGFEPDVIVGDFDSLGHVPEGGNVIRLPVEKDCTDTAYALGYALDKGFGDIHIFGALGGDRPDHSFANIILAAKASAAGAACTLTGREQNITAVTSGRIVFSPDFSGDLSVFALSDAVRDFTESGFKYSVENVTLKNTDTFTVSNSFAGAEGVISAEKGTFIVYYSRRKDGGMPLIQNNFYRTDQNG